MGVGRAKEQSLANANRAIYRCIERGLEVIGPSGRQVVLFLVESRFQVAKERLPEDPEGLVFALRSIFSTGAACLLGSIIHELRRCSPQNAAEGSLIESYANVLREGQLAVEAGVTWARSPRLLGNRDA